VILSYRVTSNKIDNNTSKSSSTKTVNVVAIAPAQVSITKNGFSPQTIKIKVNQGIIWTNNDTAQHQVSSDPYPTDNGLADFNQQQPMSQNQSWDFVFSQTGTFSYHDNLNPYTFKGTVIVVK
jgi:plastocyanin